MYKVPARHRRDTGFAGALLCVVHFVKQNPFAAQFDKNPQREILFLMGRLSRPCYVEETLPFPVTVFTTKEIVSMRVPTALAVLALLCAPLAPMTSGQNAPAAPATPTCDGVLNILRVSDITPGASIENFKAAVAAQQEWYKSHGFADVIFAAPVIVRDSTTHAESYSSNEMVTYHYLKPGGASPQHDAAWDAFVKMFSDTSTIKESYVQCVPMEGAPASMK